jgi:hypothetical protein
MITIFSDVVKKIDNMDNNVGMAQRYEHEIPEGYEARIEGNKVILKLKESEDERIRKMLIEQMERWKKCAEDNNVEQDVKDASDAIAYLEKQKDKVVEFDHDREQQPAKEDGPFDEDKFLEGELAAFLQNYDKEYDDDAAISDVAIHFYELGKKMKQQPAEWSEEDEAAYNAFICEVINEKMNPTIEQVKWLRSICDRLKSLRPQSHWKPSNEQMNALKLVARGFMTDDPSVIDSLLADLQKLL